MTIKVNKEVANFLENSTTKVITDDGTVYYYLPFWFTKTKERDVFEEFSFDELPEKLIRTIKEFRI